MTTKREIEKNKVDFIALRKKELIDKYLRNQSKYVRFKILNMGDWAISHASHIQKDIEAKVTNEHRRYLYFKEGTIVKVDFGVNVGSEISGDHYAIVLDKSDNNKKNLITVVPLSSKDNSAYVSIDLSMIYAVLTKIEEYHGALEMNMKLIREKIESIGLLLKNDDQTNLRKFIEKFLREDCNEINGLIGFKEIYNADYALEKFVEGDTDEVFSIFNKMIDNAESYLRMYEEIHYVYIKYLKNSYAIVGNITTVSKTRIRNKINALDPINSVRIGDNEISKIRLEINKRYGFEEKPKKEKTKFSKYLFAKLFTKN